MMQLLKNKSLRSLLLLSLLAMLVGGGYAGMRVYRMAHIAYDWESQIRYMIDNGGSIGTAPAQRTFSDAFLEIIFGDNPSLLEQLKVVIRRGLEEDPSAEMGEVAAMLVTYRIDTEGEVTDVAAQIIGGFPVSRSVPQFNRDGYFESQLDPDLLNVGNTMLRFAGRDMLLFAQESVAADQLEIIDAIFNGEIQPLVGRLEVPFFYTMVLPNPRGVVPPQLRQHIQAISQSGFISAYEGASEIIFLTSGRRSADYAASVINDMRRLAEATLRARCAGEARGVNWGTQAGVWWAAEMTQVMERLRFERDQNIIRIDFSYDRVMMNALMKTIERFGRDWSRMQARKAVPESAGVAALVASAREVPGYWSEGHRWGPDWPIAPSAGETAETDRAREITKLVQDAVQDVQARIREEERLAREAELEARRLQAELEALRAAEQAQSAE
jgi:hypothetical protein